MTRREVIAKAITGTLSWVQAAEIIGVTARHTGRIRWVVENKRVAAVMDLSAYSMDSPATNDQKCCHLVARSNRFDSIRL